MYQFDDIGLNGFLNVRRNYEMISIRIWTKPIFFTSSASRQSWKSWSFGSSTFFVGTKLNFSAYSNYHAKYTSWVVWKSILFFLGVCQSSTERLLQQKLRSIIIWHIVHFVSLKSKTEHAQIKVVKNERSVFCRNWKSFKDIWEILKENYTTTFEKFHFVSFHIDLKLKQPQKSLKANNCRLFPIQVRGK